MHCFDPLVNYNKFSNGITAEYEWKREGENITMNLFSDKIYNHKEVCNYLYNNSVFTDNSIFIRVVQRIRHEHEDHLCCLISQNLDEDQELPLLYRSKESDYPNYSKSDLVNSIIINRGEGLMSAINGLEDGQNMIINLKDEKGDKTKNYYAVRNIKRTLYFNYIRDKGERGRLFCNTDKKKGFEFFNKDRFNQLFKVYSSNPMDCDFKITQAEFNRICSEFLLELNEKKVRIQFSSFLRNAGTNSNPSTFLFLLDAIINDLYQMELGLATIANSEKYKIIKSLQEGTYKIGAKAWYECWKKTVVEDKVSNSTKTKIDDHKIDPSNQKNFKVSNQSNFTLNRVLYGITKVGKVGFKSLKIAKKNITCLSRAARIKIKESMIKKKNKLIENELEVSSSNLILNSERSESKNIIQIYKDEVKKENKKENKSNKFNINAPITKEEQRFLNIEKAKIKKNVELITRISKKKEKKEKYSLLFFE
jgi:hypothetical protein